MPAAEPRDRVGPRPSGRSGAPFVLLALVTAAVLVGTIQVMAFRAPVEATMGIVQKIFYFHVPAAYAMYLGAAICFVGSVAYLAKGSHRADAVARAGAEASVVMGLLVLTSGPLWAAKAWGVYWTWDPRLTTSMLSVLVYVAYVVLRAFTGGGEAERKFAAALGILGAANLPIIHFSVRKWGGTHPQVITGRGGGLSHPDMKLALLLGFVAFTLLTIVMVWLRARQDLARGRLEAVEEEAMDRGLLDD